MRKRPKALGTSLEGKRIDLLEKINDEGKSYSLRIAMIFEIVCVIFSFLS